MTLLVAPGLEHKFPPEWRREGGRGIRQYAGPGRAATPLPARPVYHLHAPVSVMRWVEIPDWISTIVRPRWTPVVRTLVYRDYGNAACCDSASRPATRRRRP